VEDQASGINYRHIFETCPDILSLMDAQGRLLANSPAAERIHGYPAERLLGEATGDFVHPEDAPQVMEKMGLAFRNPGTVVLVRYRYLNSDGSYVWMDARGVAGPGPSGGLLLTVVSRDATALVAAEELLERTLREKEELVREIQHRVKNSIAMISSFVALEEGRAMSRGEDGGADAAEAARLAAVLQNLRFRIDSVSNLYRILFSSGDPAWVDLKVYLDRVIFDIAQTLDRPGVSMTLEIDTVAIDTKRAGPLGILCTELVTNALRHAFLPEAEGRLQVTLRVLGGELVLEVSDNGSGLPAGFDLEAAEGLGLQLARMLALQLKGRLAAGAVEGGGTKFRFSMPWPGQA